MASDPVLGFLDTSKYKDVVKGSWKETGSGKGEWGVEGGQVKGLYQAGSSANTVDLYLDLDKNGSITTVDKKVGTATLGASTTGGQGGWNWSESAKAGDFFGSTGQDVGSLSLTDATFLQPGVKWDAVYSSTSYTLATGLQQLVLTGTSDINGTGNGLDNTIVGNSGRNTIDGKAGKDILTGLGGQDVFRLTALSDSLLQSYDRVTDFTIGEDKLQGPISYSSAISNLGSVPQLTGSGISGKLTETTFKSNAAAMFTFGAQSFVAFNDGIAGFDQGKDAIVEITGYKLLGNLTIANISASIL